MTELMIFVESNTTGTGRLFAERARDLGLVPYLLSADASRYPYVAELGIAHQRCRTDSSAAVRASCRRLAGTHLVAGVTSSSDYYLAAAAGAARDLGLPGEDPRLLAAARDKGYQRRRFAAHGVGSPAFHLAGSADQAVWAAEQLGPPVVVKPVSRSGSIGVRRCDTVSDVATHAANLLAATEDERGNQLPPTILVESYLAGREFSVELLGDEVCAVVAKHVDESCGFLEVGHDVPAALDAQTGAVLIATARAALAALGLSWGPAHVELRVSDGRAYVVEVNPRLAGGMIPRAVQAATGRDLIAELLARTAGRRAPAWGAQHQCASIRFLVPAADGEVAAVPDTSAALTLPGVVEAAVTARPGQRTVRQGTFLDRLGYVIATGETQQQAGARAERAVAALTVTVVPPEPVASTADRGGP